MRRTIIVLAASALLAGCSSSQAASAAASASATARMGCEWSDDGCSFTISTESPASEETGAASDMSGYESYDPDTEYVFVDSNVQNMIARMNNKDTFVTYFGFSSCPWCRDAMPILNDVAKEHDSTVDYINTRLDPSWQSNLDLADYDQLTAAIGDLFPVDDDGKAHLDVPFVVFFKDGEVVYSAGYPQYDAHKEKISEENAAIERESYEKGFEAIE